ncbi:hypothetical protein Taro_001794, partial [Colocasia esculenta]|nr:hypothetical protein [Colocasia esculenta]
MEQWWRAMLQGPWQYPPQQQYQQMPAGGQQFAEMAAEEQPPPTPQAAPVQPEVDLTVEQGIATCPMSPSGLLKATGPMSPSHVQRVKCSGREHKPQFAPLLCASLISGELKLGSSVEAWEETRGRRCRRSDPWWEPGTRAPGPLHHQFKEEDVVREDEPPVSERRIEDIAPELIELVGRSVEGVIPPLVPAPAIIEESVDSGAAHTEWEHEDIQIEETLRVLVVETAMEESHEDIVPEVVAPGHIEDVQMEDAPAQGEPDVQGEPAASALVDQFQEGLVGDTSDEDDEPAAGSGVKGKSVAPEIPLLTIKAHHRSRKKKSDVTSIFLNQSTEAKDVGAVKSELQEMR